MPDDPSAVAAFVLEVLKPPERDVTQDEGDRLHAALYPLARAVQDNDARSTHSCHEHCTRVECVQRREIGLLREQLAEMTRRYEGHGGSLSRHLPKIPKLQAEVERLQEAIQDATDNVDYTNPELTIHKLRAVLAAKSETEKIT